MMLWKISTDESRYFDTRTFGGNMTPLPIEYKRGKPKDHECGYPAGSCIEPCVWKKCWIVQLTGRIVL